MAALKGYRVACETIRLLAGLGARFAVIVGDGKEAVEGGGRVDEGIKSLLSDLPPRARPLHLVPSYASPPLDHLSVSSLSRLAVPSAWSERFVVCGGCRHLLFVVRVCNVVKSFCACSGRGGPVGISV